MNFIGKNHIVPLLFPQDITTSATDTDIVSLENYNHACLIIMTGTNSKGCTLTVEECDTVGPNDAVAIAFRYRKMGTSDVWGDLTAVESSGVVIADGDDDAVYAIEIDSQELSDGYPMVRVALSAPASGNNLYSGEAILSEARYPQHTPVTAIA